MINKTNKKKTFTQKYKFEIINSTSVSDNSFFPPLRKVQSCIVLKAIYESQRQAGRRGGMSGRELVPCGLQRATELGSRVEKPTRKLHPGSSLSSLSVEGRYKWV